ncbi:glutathione S-transferase 1-like [Choristoneura fumiferana]|uniref:glutathione S-transferase 1-like n=1 Tax=Choristoneura fumiferana TaxID=7141 RepID=UPI003D15817A
MRITKTLWNKASAARLLLYKRDASPPSNAVRVLGAMLGLQFDFEEPDLLQMEHRTPEYRKINPMATIPVLKDGDFTLAESHAINLYLLSKYGGEQKEVLYPSDLKTRAVIDQCLFFDAGMLFRRLLEVSQPAFIGKIDSASSTHIRNIEEGYGIVETYLESSPYVAGDRLTLADISLGCTVAGLEGIHPVDADKFPKCKAWLARLAAEPYFKEFAVAGGVLFGKLLRHVWRRNKKAD